MTSGTLNDTASLSCFMHSAAQASADSSILIYQLAPKDFIQRMEESSEALLLNTANLLVGVYFVRCKSGKVTLVRKLQ